MSVDYTHAYGEVQETRSAFSGVSSGYTQGKLLLLNLLLLLFIIDVVDVKSRYFVIKFVIVKVLLLLMMMIYIMRYFISLARVQLMKFKKNGFNYTLFHSYNFEKSF